MYASPTVPMPSDRPAPSRWRVRDDIPYILRPGEPCKLVGHRADRGHVYFVVEFIDGERLEYLPGDLDVDAHRA